MDEFQLGKPGGQDADKVNSLDNGIEVSHSPLNLGGGAASDVANSEAPPAEGDAAKRVSWHDRITGVKTFLTKLHPGAIAFLDEQICNWLRDNPGVNIKRTNIVIGDVISKKTESNIIITVWY